MGIDRTSEEDFRMSEKNEEVKRTPPEEFQNVEGARLDLSGEFTAIRSVKLGGALDGCGLSVGPEREPSKHSQDGDRCAGYRERLSHHIRIAPGPGEARRDQEEVSGTER